MEFVYLREGDGEAPCAYERMDEAVADILSEYKNASKPQLHNLTNGHSAMAFGNGTVITIRRVRLYRSGEK